MVPGDPTAAPGISAYLVLTSNRSEYLSCRLRVLHGFKEQECEALVVTLVEQEETAVARYLLRGRTRCCRKRSLWPQPAARYRRGWHRASRWPKRCVISKVGHVTPVIVLA